MKTCISIVYHNLNVVGHQIELQAVWGECERVHMQSVEPLHAYISSELNENTVEPLLKDSPY